MEFVTGCVKNIFEKTADPIVAKIVDFVKDEWEKFKIDSDIVFRNYLENAYEKYSKVKTMLYRTEPKYLYDFFELPTVLLKNSHPFQRIDGSDINNLLDVSHFLIISGTGGIGKSTFMKHLFISELESKDLIPMFIELKDLNTMGNDYDIADFLFSKLHNLGSGIDRKYLEYALKTGCFLFLFDGYDEIASEKQSIFLCKLTDFCDLYTENYYILSSRPYSQFIEFQRFTVLTLDSYSKTQALSLIQKIDFDEVIKAQFTQALNDFLYDKHRSFASNPLLLNIMLLTYDNYAEIPNKLHLFYAQAFDTLYSKHDATKGGYKRELCSKLSFDSFRTAFSNFCFLTYYRGEIEFTYDDLISYLKTAKVNGLEFDVKGMIDDLINALCVLCKDGLVYRFTHRSFQEYFTALFLKELSDDNLKKIGLGLIQQDPIRSANDSTFHMLFDMARERMEQSILLPLLISLEEGCTINKYDFYLLEIDPQFEFDFFRDGDSPRLGMLTNSGSALTRFVREFDRYYSSPVPTNNSDDRLLNYLIENLDYEIGHSIKAIDILENPEIYNLFKETWIGKTIERISKMKEVLIDKKRETALGLDALLMV